PRRIGRANAAVFRLTEGAPLSMSQLSREARRALEECCCVRRKQIGKIFGESRKRTKNAAAPEMMIAAVVAAPWRRASTLIPYHFQPLRGLSIELGPVHETHRIICRAGRDHSRLREQHHGRPSPADACLRRRTGLGRKSLHLRAALPHLPARA